MVGRVDIENRSSGVFWLVHYGRDKCSALSAEYEIGRIMAKFIAFDGVNSRDPDFEFGARVRCVAAAVLDAEAALTDPDWESFWSVWRVQPPPEDAAVATAFDSGRWVLRTHRAGVSPDDTGAGSLASKGGRSSQATEPIQNFFRRALLSSTVSPSKSR